MKDIIVEVTGSITIVQMGQRIDFSNAKEYEEMLLNVLAPPQPQAAVIW